MTIYNKNNIKILGKSEDFKEWCNQIDNTDLTELDKEILLNKCIKNMDIFLSQQKNLMRNRRNIF